MVSGGMEDNSKRRVRQHTHKGSGRGKAVRRDGLYMEINGLAILVF
jgi:hypothetical protein